MSDTACWVEGTSPQGAIDIVSGFQDVYSYEQKCVNEMQLIKLTAQNSRVLTCNVNGSRFKGNGVIRWDYNMIFETGGVYEGVIN